MWSYVQPVLSSFFFVTGIFILLTIWLKHDNLRKQVAKEYQQEGPNSNNFISSEYTWGGE